MNRQEENNTVQTFSVRGATQLREDTVEAMRNNVVELMEQIRLRNHITHEKDIISIQFTQTPDVTSANPARELRTSGYANTSLFCSLEPTYPDSLPRAVRVLVTYRAEAGHKPEPVYLNGAAVLRMNG